MKNFYVVANNTKDGALDIAAEIKEYLGSKNATCVVDETRSGFLDRDAVPENTDCILVLGGDGTMLRAVGCLNGTSIPFLGINMGHLGFLSSVEKKDAIEAVDRVLRDDYVIEERMMITGDVQQSGVIAESPRALNEIVVTGQKPMELISVSIYINGQHLTNLSGDGVLIATPTGSTGYNMSAGGPIINPTARMMILTPICAHSMQSRSIAFSSEDTIRIEIEGGRHGEIQQALAVFDGATKMSLVSGDSISIRKSRKITKIVKLTEESFLETLQNKFKDE